MRIRDGGALATSSGLAHAEVLGVVDRLVGGSDLAAETADVILVHDVIAALVAWGFVGHLSLPRGVVGHGGSTVVVTLDGLRLLGRGVWRSAREDAKPVGSAVRIDGTR